MWQMHLETSNHFYGETVCPFNTKLTSGGSSGGEGALIGLRGSCLGIGTDIGVSLTPPCLCLTTNRYGYKGSIRSPAANNGLYGLRPTSYRLPLAGLHATMLGESSFRNQEIVSIRLLAPYLTLSPYFHRFLLLTS